MKERPTDTPGTLAVLTLVDEELQRLWAPLSGEVLEDHTVLACRCGVKWEGKTEIFVLARLFEKWEREHQAGKPSRLDPTKICGPERRHDRES